MTGDDYEREWQIELEVERFYKKDYPTGSFARWLPQFRPSRPDPVSDHYRQLARQRLREGLAKPDP